MKIGILTFHYSNNYGALLQAYALSTTLYNLGFEPFIINRNPDINDINISFLQNVKFKISHIISTYFKNSFYQFRKNHLPNITELVNSDEELKRIVTRFDAVIVGSDQVWRIEYTKGLGLNNFLDFVPDNIKKIAYAASFGKEEFDNDTNTIIKIKGLLSRFTAISVREDSGVTICKDLFNIEAEHLIDPTLLLDPNDYQLIIGKRNSCEREYVAKYLLDSTKQKSEIVTEFAKKNHLNVINLSKESDTDYTIRQIDFNFKKYYYPSFSNWLQGIKYANFIITDSFHGVVFSILFNKQFVCIANNSRGLGRMTSLLRKFGLEDRLIFASDKLNFNITRKIIDYSLVNKIIKTEKNKSIEFLVNSLRK